ncbi:MAG: iron transporter [Acidobacteria bacterium]|nr:iron transporter [Acidobacteriota bacterium]
MPVVVQNKKASDTSHIWLIVSKVTAAVLGGYVVTYWTGIAVARTAMGWDLLSRADAGMISGPVQLVVYVAVILGVCGAASMRKAWLVLALLTAPLVGVTVLSPGPSAAVNTAAQ